MQDVEDAGAVDLVDQQQVRRFHAFLEEPGAAQAAGLPALGRMVRPIHPQPDTFPHKDHQAFRDDPNPPLGRLRILADMRLNRLGADRLARPA